MRFVARIYAWLRMYKNPHTHTLVPILEADRKRTCRRPYIVGIFVWVAGAEYLNNIKVYETFTVRVLRVELIKSNKRDAVRAVHAHEEDAFSGL